MHCLELCDHAERRRLNNSEQKLKPIHFIVEINVITIVGKLIPQFKVWQID